MTDTSGKITTPVERLAALGVGFTVREHAPWDRPLDVCAELGVSPADTVKTLAFVTRDTDRLVLAAIPGHARLRYGPLARAADVRRADLVPAPNERLAALGMTPGGVCPVCADPTAIVVFDETVPAMGPIHCGSGRRDASLALTASTLFAAVPSARTAPIAAVPTPDTRDG